jgi:hypothetical protein
VISPLLSVLLVLAAAPPGAPQGPEPEPVPTTARARPAPLPPARKDPDDELLRNLDLLQDLELLDHLELFDEGR